MAREARGHGARHDDEPVRITTAGTNAADEIAARQRRYVIAMAIRTACFIGAVVADGWLRWVLVAAALLLPYVAVVMANAVVSRDDGFDLPAGAFGTPELGGEGPRDAVPPPRP